MKSFLIPIRPKWCAKIFNGEKTIEIRRNAPKDWVDYLSGKTKIKPEPMTGYIYCTKTIKPISDYDWGDFTFDDLPKLGKVVAKFTLREVERIMYLPLSLGLDERHKHKCYSCVFEDRYKEGFNQENYSDYFTEGSDDNYLVYYSKMKASQIHEYLKGGKGYAWHISDLQIFDEPKELSEFMKPNWDKGLAKALSVASKKDARILEGVKDGVPNYEELTLQGYMYEGRIEKPPQSWAYVEEIK